MVPREVTPQTYISRARSGRGFQSSQRAASPIGQMGPLDPAARMT